MLPTILFTDVSRNALAPIMPNLKDPLVSQDGVESHAHIDPGAVVVTAPGSQPVKTLPCFRDVRLAAMT